MSNFVTNLMIFNNDYSRFKNHVKSKNSEIDFNNIKSIPEDLVPTRFIYANGFYIEKIIQYSILQDLKEYGITLDELKDRLLKLYNINEEDIIGFDKYYFDSVFRFIEHLMDNNDIDEICDKLYYDVLTYVKRFDKYTELSLYGPTNVRFLSYMKNDLKVDQKEYIDKIISKTLDIDKFTIKQIGHFYYKFLFKYGVINENMWYNSYWGSLSNAIKPKWYKNVLMFDTKWSSPVIIFKYIGYKFPDLNVTCYSIYEDGTEPILYSINKGKLSERQQLNSDDCVFRYNILPLLHKIEYV